MWISILSTAVLVITLAYVLVMILIVLGWRNLEIPRTIEGFEFAPISIVVAARNEENNILNLLESILHMDYPLHSFELIVVDDHSTDRTMGIIHEFILAHPNLNIKVLPAKEIGKKAAIRQGVFDASYELIATTDADCVLPISWLNIWAQAFQKPEINLAMAPVVYSQKQGVLHHFYALEFISLVASGAGAAGLQLPFMGNAANMAFRRKTFEKANQSKNSYTSGDDVFLIHQTIKHYGRKSVRFLLNPKALVETPPPETMGQFICQRLRWGSKAKGYSSIVAVLVSLVVLLTNVVLATFIMMGFWITWLWPITALLLLTKMLVDIPVVFGYASFVKRTYLKKWFVPFSLVYPFYIVIVGFSSIFISFNWKGRRFSR